MPLWIQYSQALAAPAIALLAIVVAVMQWRGTDRSAVDGLSRLRAHGHMMRSGSWNRQAATACGWQLEAAYGRLSSFTPSPAYQTTVRSFADRVRKMASLRGGL
jgi:hypothetical protein